MKRLNRKRIFAFVLAFLMAFTMVDSTRLFSHAENASEMEEDASDGESVTVEKSMEDGSNGGEVFGEAGESASGGNLTAISEEEEQVIEEVPNDSADVINRDGEPAPTEGIQIFIGDESQSEVFNKWADVVAWFTTNGDGSKEYIIRFYDGGGYDFDGSLPVSGKAEALTIETLDSENPEEQPMARLEVPENSGSVTMEPGYDLTLNNIEIKDPYEKGLTLNIDGKTLTANNIRFEGNMTGTNEAVLSANFTTLLGDVKGFKDVKVVSEDEDNGAWLDLEEGVSVEADNLMILNGSVGLVSESTVKVNNIQLGNGWACLNFRLKGEEDWDTYKMPVVEIVNDVYNLDPNDEGCLDLYAQKGIKQIGDPNDENDYWWDYQENLDWPANTKILKVVSTFSKDNCNLGMNEGDRRNLDLSILDVNGEYYLVVEQGPVATIFEGDVAKESASDWTSVLDWFDKNGDTAKEYGISLLADVEITGEMPSKAKAIRIMGGDEGHHRILVPEDGVEKVTQTIPMTLINVDFCYDNEEAAHPVWEVKDTDLRGIDSNIFSTVKGTGKATLSTGTGNNGLWIETVTGFDKVNVSGVDDENVPFLHIFKEIKDVNVLNMKWGTLILQSGSKAELNDINTDTGEFGNEGWAHISFFYDKDRNDVMPALNIKGTVLEGTWLDLGLNTAVEERDGEDNPYLDYRIEAVWPSNLKVLSASECTPDSFNMCVPAGTDAVVKLIKNKNDFYTKRSFADIVAGDNVFEMNNWSEILSWFELNGNPEKEYTIRLYNDRVNVTELPENAKSIELVGAWEEGSTNINPANSDDTITQTIPMTLCNVVIGDYEDRNATWYVDGTELKLYDVRFEGILKGGNDAKVWVSKDVDVIKVEGFKEIKLEADWEVQEGEEGESFARLIVYEELKDVEDFVMNKKTIFELSHDLNYKFLPEIADKASKATLTNLYVDNDIDAEEWTSFVFDYGKWVEDGIEKLEIPYPEININGEIKTKSSKTRVSVETMDQIVEIREDGNEPWLQFVPSEEKMPVGLKALKAPNADLVTFWCPLPEGAEGAEEYFVKDKDGYLVVAEANYHLSKNHYDEETGEEIVDYDGSFGTWAEAAQVIEKFNDPNANYVIVLNNDLDADGALTMPKVGTYATLGIAGEGKLAFTGDITLTGELWIENGVKLEPKAGTCAVNGGEYLFSTSADFSMISSIEGDVVYLKIESKMSAKDKKCTGVLPGTITAKELRLQSHVYNEIKVVDEENPENYWFDWFEAYPDGCGEGFTMVYDVTGDISVEDLYFDGNVGNVELIARGNLEVKDTLHTDETWKNYADGNFEDPYSVVTIDLTSGKNNSITNTVIGNNPVRVKLSKVDENTRTPIVPAKDDKGNYAAIFTTTGSVLANQYRFVDDKGELKILQRTGNAITLIPESDGPEMSATLHLMIDEVASAENLGYFSEKDEKTVDISKLYTNNIIETSELGFYNDFADIKKVIDEKGKKQPGLSYIIEVELDDAVKSYSKLTLPAAKKYKGITLKGDKIVITGQKSVSLTGNMVLETELVMNDKYAKEFPLSLALGKYELVLNPAQKTTYTFTNLTGTAGKGGARLLVSDNVILVLDGNLKVEDFYAGNDTTVKGTISVGTLCVNNVGTQLTYNLDKNFTVTKQIISAAELYDIEDAPIATLVLNPLLKSGNPVFSEKVLNSEYDIKKNNIITKVPANFKLGSIEVKSIDDVKYIYKIVGSNVKIIDIKEADVLVVNVNDATDKKDFSSFDDAKDYVIHNSDKDYSIIVSADQKKADLSSIPANLVEIKGNIMVGVDLDAKNKPIKKLVAMTATTDMELAGKLKITNINIKGKGISGSGKQADECTLIIDNATVTATAALNVEKIVIKAGTDGLKDVMKFSKKGGTINKVEVDVTSGTDAATMECASYTGFKYAEAVVPN